MAPLNETSPHRLLCMYTHIRITYTRRALGSLWHASKWALCPGSLGSPLLTTPARSRSSILPPLSGLIRCVNSPMGVLAKSFSLCGQMRGSSQIAPLMTFLLSLELLSLPKDNFPVMTKVSDSINFHLSEKCGSN